MSRANMTPAETLAARERQIYLLRQHMQRKDEEEVVIEGEGEEEEEEEEEEGSGSDEEEYEDEGEAWVTSLLKERGNEFLCEINPDYIVDGFNLTGLERMAPEYERALDLILDDVESDDSLTDEQLHEINESAEVLYGLIHARYIITAEGLDKMHEKFKERAFGCCPRVSCKQQPVLPTGLSDAPFMQAVALYCPACQEVYHPPSRRHGGLDGAYFGTTFAHLFLLTKPNLIPSREIEPYVPKVFGFRIHKESPYFKRREPKSWKRESSASPSKEIANSQQAPLASSRSSEARGVEV